MKIVGTGILLSVVVTVSMGAAAASAQESAGIEFVAQPAPGNSEHNGYFKLGAEPGEVVRQRLLLRNDSDRRLTLKLFPLDAETGLYGGVDYGLSGEKVNGVGTWIELERSRVTLEPGTGGQVDFTIRVPQNASEGHNLAGIGVSSVSDEQEGTPAESGTTGAQVIVERRRVIAVQINVPGSATPALKIDGVTPSARADGIYLGIDIAGTGSALTKGSGVLQITEPEAFEHEFVLETFVPGTKISYPIRWRDAAPNGEYRASVRLSYDGGRKVAEWSGSFAIGDVLQADLHDRGAQVDRGIGRLPGAAAVATIAIAALIVALMVSARRRRRPPRHQVAPQTRIVRPASVPIPPTITGAASQSMNGHSRNGHHGVNGTSRNGHVYVAGHAQNGARHDRVPASSPRRLTAMAPPPPPPPPPGPPVGSGTERVPAEVK